jgi:phage shock protein A
VLESELIVLEDTLAKLGDDIHALQTKIKDAKNRQNSIVLRGQAAQTRLGVRRQLNEHNIDDAMVRFEGYERKMDDLEGQVEAFDLGSRSLADEIDELDRSDAVDAELEALKDAVRGRQQAAKADQASQGADGAS